VSKRDGWQVLSYGQKSLITLDVVKNRHGATGWFDAKFEGEFSRVKEIKHV
jgi:replicative DNA helicase